MVEKISAPSPSVVHLVTIFSQISRGEIKIPAFQRDYVWTEKQIISLLESVYDSFPIGSLLFWRVDKKALEIAPRKLSAFPETEEVFPLSYVLDGMQRLTTLYGVFHFEPDTYRSSLNIGFDLRLKKFKIMPSESKQGEILLHMSSLFSPKKLLSFQASISLEEDSEELMNSVLTLQSAFQAYMVPTVTIQSSDIERVVGIFERVNSTGTRLNSVDFMRAITWTNSFDLSSKLKDVSVEISEYGWDVREGTLIKFIAVLLGMEVSSESLIEMRSADETKLHAAFDLLPDIILRTSEVLEQSFGIISPEVVSYEGQLLVTFQLCHLGILDDVREEFQRWFWACGLNEQLRGKPDDYVVNLLRLWSRNNIQSPERIQPNFTERDFLTRRLLARAAFTNTFKMMLANKEARNFRSCDVIQSSEYLSSGNTDQLIPVLTKQELSGLQDLIGKNINSAKLFCNSVLYPAGTTPRGQDIRNEILALLEDNRLDVLETQFITEEAAFALRDSHFGKFLLLRAECMNSFARDLLALD